MRFIRQALLGALVVSAISFCLTGCGGSVAKVNGQKISRKEYLDRLEKLTINMNGQQREVGSIALEGLIQEKLRLQLAKKEGVEPTKEQIKQRLDMMRADGSAARLKAQGWTDDDLRNNAITRQADLNLVSKGVTVTEKDREDFYHKYVGQLFTAPEGAEIGLIVTSSQKKTDQVSYLLKVKHAEFTSVAAKLCDIQVLRESKGMLGFIPKDINLIQKDRRPPPTVYQAMFSVKQGDVSEPIKVGNTWYTVKVIDRRDEKVRSFASARSQINDMVLLQKAQEMYSDKKKHGITPAKKLEGFYKDANVKIRIRRYAPLWDTVKKSMAAQEQAQQTATPPTAP